MLRLCIAALLLAGVFCLPSSRDHVRTTSKTLTVTNGRPDGTWRKEEYCPTGTYATGFQMNTDLGTLIGDETGMNGVELKCSGLDVHDTTFYGVANSKFGTWGTWMDNQYCEVSENDRRFLRRFKMRVQEKFTAANNLIFECSEMDGSNVYEIEGEGTNFGSWGEFSESCDNNSAICGLNISFETPNYLDDTAVNDVEFYCCPM